jgi:anti-anti-sigma regulatory factor
MKKKEQPAYQVYAEKDFVFTKVNGRASYLNCAPLKEFLHGQVAEGYRCMAFDFEGCSSMDSTFLGILVGVALELRKTDPPGSVALLQLGERNLEVVRNLGIHRLVSVEAGDLKMDFGATAKTIEANGDRAQADEELICEAHKRLSELNEKNARLFKDVVGFLEQHLEED